MDSRASYVRPDRMSHALFRARAPHPGVMAAALSGVLDAERARTASLDLRVSF